jgi:hypothetical protein
MLFTVEIEKKRNVSGYADFWGLAHDSHALGDRSDRRKKAPRVQPVTGCTVGVRCATAYAAEFRISKSYDDENGVSNTGSLYYHAH